MRRTPAPNGVTGVLQSAGRPSPILVGGSDNTAAATLPTNIDPERAFAGSLLWLPSERALAAAALVDVEDLIDPRLRVVLQLVREVATAGVAPDPVAVMGHARAIGTVTTAHSTKALAELLADIYGDVPTAASVGWYAARVLDDSLRRRCILAGDRIGQAGESSPLAGLVGTVGAETVAVHTAVVRRGRVLASLGMPVDEVA